MFFDNFLKFRIVSKNLKNNKETIVCEVSSLSKAQRIFVYLNSIKESRIYFIEEPWIIFEGEKAKIEYNRLE